ncbi:unnamed protein product [Menidia menidia]|uniref:(Atlantic silverside) hypothetical protein n=1 Tax=Menidia menidia TaxID=238744 RepID=A0A8S4BM11_9TELE|nr:unnamed protein product [Menidia menidia]
MPSALPTETLCLCQEADKDPPHIPGVRPRSQEPSWEMFAATAKMAGLALELMLCHAEEILICKEQGMEDPAVSQGGEEEAAGEEYIAFDLSKGCYGKDAGPFKPRQELAHPGPDSRKCRHEAGKIRSCIKSRVYEIPPKQCLL